MADRRSGLRLPPRTGLALGLVLGMTVGVVLGRLVDLRALGMVLGLVLGVVFGLLLDNDRAAEDDPGARNSDEDGGIARALLWVLAGLVVLVLLALVIAPELLDAPGRLSAVLLLVLAAGVPGVVLLLALVGRRRRIDGHQRREGGV